MQIFFLFPHNEMSHCTICCRECDNKKAACGTNFQICSALACMQRRMNGMALPILSTLSVYKNAKLRHGVRWMMVSLKYFVSRANPI